MNTTLFITTTEQYGIVIYKDDNEIGLVLDDGTITYEDKYHLRHANNPQTRIRGTLWGAATLNYKTVPEAAEHYRQTLKHWLGRVAGAGKTCTQCNEFKPFNDFHVSIGNADGYKSQCKACYARDNAERYKARKQKD